MKPLPPPAIPERLADFVLGLAPERIPPAVALRAKAPIFVDTKVLDQVRSVEITSDRTEREHLQKWLESLDPDDLGYKM